MTTRVLAALAGSIALAFADAAAAQAARPLAPATAPKAKAAQGATDTAFKLVLEPRAMALLKATSDKLAAAKSMSFTATVGYEYPSKLGPTVVYTKHYDVAMQRPDRLRVLDLGDGPMSEVYFDGRTITAYAPAENLVAVADAPPTIDAALATAFRSAQIYFPFSELVAADPYRALTDDAILAFTIGRSEAVGGIATDVLAWANDSVFLQMWIGADDKLPRRIRATFRTDPLRLRHEMSLSNWALDPTFAPGVFVQEKALAAGRMAFAAPALPPGAKPLARPKSTSARPDSPSHSSRGAP